VQGSKN
jgi:hypothetical protein